jgi:hypothetical protein
MMIVTIFAAVRWKCQWQEAFASQPGCFGSGIGAGVQRYALIYRRFFYYLRNVRGLTPWI